MPRRKRTKEQIKLGLGTDGLPLEQTIVKEIFAYLHGQGLFFWPTKNLPSPTGRGGFRRPPKYYVPGVADVSGIYNGLPVFFEVKRHNGSQSNEQKVFEYRVILNRGKYFVVRSVQDVIKALEEIN